MANLQEMLMQFLMQNGKPKPKIMGTGMASNAGNEIEMRNQLNEAVARGDYETAQRIQEAIESRNQTQTIQ